MASHRPKTPYRAQTSPLPRSLSDLPSPQTTRWVIRRKAEVVAGVRLGILSLEEACQRYRLSVDEFETWRAMIEAHGLLGLRTTRIQHYRGRQEELDYFPPRTPNPRNTRSSS